jgi:hypothetical protein
MLNVFLNPVAIVSFMAATAISGQTSLAIQKSDLHIGKFTLGLQKRNVRAILGKPAKVVVDKVSLLDDQIHYYYHYKDLVFNFGGDELCRIECSSKLFSTPRGIRVGDNIQKIEQLYGQGDLRIEGSKTAISFTLEGTDCHLTFNLINNSIISIHIWLDYA